MSEEIRIVRISVRSFVEFLLRSGSLESRGGLSAETAMLEGARIHRALQKKEGPGYRAEVSLSREIPISGRDLAEAVPGGKSRFHMEEVWQGPEEKQTADLAAADEPDERLETPCPASDEPDERLEVPCPASDEPDERLEAPSAASDGSEKRLETPSAASDESDEKPASDRAGAGNGRKKDYILRLEGRADGIYCSSRNNPDFTFREAGEAGNTGDTGDTVHIEDAGNTVHTWGAGDTMHTGETGHTGDTVHIEDAGNTMHTGGVGDTGDTGNAVHTGGAGNTGAVGDSGDLWVIDEIKTVFRGFRELREAAEVHLAQARCYAWIFAEQEKLDRIGIRMTYCSQVTGEVKYFYEAWDYSGLKAWLEELTASFLPWLGMRASFEESRTGTLKKMTFPFPYRPGQYDLAAGVYRTIVHGKKLFLQAPTGTGKTMAVLFPSLKAIGEGKAERIFYLTAKAVAGRAAVEALNILKKKGLSVRSLVLASRERICPCETVDCNPAACSRAKGHYNRVNAALWDLLQAASEGQPMTSEMVSEYAGAYGVCPYELALDASDFADVIICDYNYAFHPEAKLTRFFGGPGQASPAGRTILLIDEAHNLLERGREMYSACLSYREVRQFRKSIKAEWPRLWKKMKNLVRILRLLDQECFGKKGEENDGAKKDRAENDRVNFERTKNDRANSGGLKNDWAKNDRLNFDRANFDWVKNDRAGFDRLKNDREEFRVLSGWIREEGKKLPSSSSSEFAIGGAREKGKELISSSSSEPEAEPAGDEGQEKEELLEENGQIREELLSTLLEVEDVIHWILEQERKNEVLYELSGGGESAGDEKGLTEILEFYFEIAHFRQMLEEMDGHYIVYGEKGARGPAGGFSLHLYCADPSRRLKECMAVSSASILFSATFLPIQYYKSLLGGGPEDFEMYARSSFSPERRRVIIVNDVTSRYRSRNAENYERIARSIAGAVSCRPGNYLAFFPSYLFLEGVLEAFGRIIDDSRLSGDGGNSGNREICVLAQKRHMEDNERAAFLEAFEEIRSDRYLVGFCVMGGMFGEGIDLRDDRLIGTFVVGTGIPPADSRREMLRRYFNENGSDGYDFAYRFPGMNKVLQAAGRVIRTERDRGVVLLLDERFERPGNRGLFPVEWGNPSAMDSSAAAESVRQFWEEGP